MIEFKKTIDPDNRFCISEVSIKVHNEVGLPELLEEFGNFLKACGYQFDGEVDIVNEDEVTMKYNPSALVEDDEDFNELALDEEEALELGGFVDQRTT